MVDTLYSNQILTGIFSVLSATWFIWLPVALFFILREEWLKFKRLKFVSGLKWILLEVKVPREVAKSPKAMESILAGIHGTSKNPDLIEKYFKGVVSPWFSFEIVGDETGVHFYVWTQEFFKRMIESQIYAQYPTTEISLVEDYTKNLPPVLPDKDWNLWGTEFILTKPDAYPIRTYEDFTLEKVSLKEEESKIDPLSALVEFLGTLTGGEKIWMQFVIKPADDAWKVEGEKLVGKLSGKESKTHIPAIFKVVHNINNLIGLGGEGERKESKSPNLTSGEKVIIEAIEENISKIGFETGIRWVYLARRDKFNSLAVPAIIGIFKQFASPTLNGFKPNKMATTSAGYFNKEKIELQKKSRIFNAYRLRSFFSPPYTSKHFVLNSTELATIYHFPGTVVGSPGMTRIEAKKGAPPSNLPI